MDINEDYPCVCSINSNGSGREIIYQPAPQYSVSNFMLSPDGQKIACLVNDTNNNTNLLWVMNSDGSTPTQLTNAINPSPLYWHYSGNTICYRSSGAWRKIGIDNTGDQAFNGPPSYGVDLSPVGDSIVFIYYGNISVLKENGIDSKQLTFSSGISSNFVKWSPDGTKILFYTSDNTICTMDADGKNTFVLGVGTYPSWSSDSSKVVYTDYQNLYTVHADGTNKVKITNNTLPAFAAPFAWSGDSVRLVFWQAYVTLGVPPQAMECYISDKTGTNITSFPGVNANCWAPQIDKMLYNRGNLICSIRDDGTNTMVLYTSSYSGGPGYSFWSPDCSKIVFSDSNDIWVMDANGSNAVDLTNTPDTADYSPAWSPDGNSIAYFRYVSGFFYGDVWVMNSDGSNKIILTSSGRVTAGPAWSPDGSKIAYLQDDGYYVMNKDGTGKLKLCSLTSMIFFFLPPPVWKDDNSLFITALFGTGMTYTCTINSDGTNLQKFCYFLSNGNQKIAMSPDHKKVFYIKGFNTYVTDFSASLAGAPAEPGVLKPVNNVFDPTKGDKTTIQYKVPVSGRVTIKLYTSDGVYIKTLLDAEVAGGTTGSVDWFGRNLNDEVVASGIYLVHIEAPGYSATKKICIIK